MNPRPDYVPPLDELLVIEEYVRDGCHFAGETIDAHPDVDHEALGRWQSGDPTDVALAIDDLVEELADKPNTLAVLRQLFQVAGVTAAAVVETNREPEIGS